MSDEPVIEVDDLRKTYVDGLFRRRRVKALGGVTFQAHRGQIFGLLGPNGAGKTTLIKILLGIVRKSGGGARVVGGPVGDRLGRNLRHLVTLLDELQVIGVSFVSLNEGIDCTTPAGRLQLHVLAALAEFERARIAERVSAGLARAKRHGTRLGRPEKIVPDAVLAPVRGLSVREAAKRLGVSPTTAYRWLFRKPL